VFATRLKEKWKESEFTLGEEDLLSHLPEIMSEEAVKEALMGGQRQQKRKRKGSN